MDFLQVLSNAKYSVRELLEVVHAENVGKRTFGQDLVVVCRGLLLLGASVASLTGVAGCSSPQTHAQAVPDNGSSLATWVSYFESTGALGKVSAEQRGVLEESARSGDLSYEDVTGLIALVFDCVERQGLHAEWLDPLQDYGFPVPAYAISESSALGSTASRATIDDCTERYSSLAEQLYIWQPKNAAIENEKWTREDRATMVACLRANGVEIDDDATRSEIEMAALDLSSPTGPTDDPVFGVDCFPSS